MTRGWLSLSNILLLSLCANLPSAHGEVGTGLNLRDDSLISQSKIHVGDVNINYLGDDIRHLDSLRRKLEGSATNTEEYEELLGSVASELRHTPEALDSALEIWDQLKSRQVTEFFRIWQRIANVKKSNERLNSSTLASKDKYRAAINAFQQGDFQEAERSLMSVREDYAEILGRWNKIRDELNSAIDEGSAADALAASEVSYQIAQLRASQSRFDEARSYLDEAIYLLPQNEKNLGAEYRYEAAALSYQANNYIRAEADLIDFLAFADKHLPPLDGLRVPANLLYSDVLRALGKLQEASERSSIALALTRKLEEAELLDSPFLKLEALVQSSQMSCAVGEDIVASEFRREAEELFDEIIFKLKTEQDLSAHYCSAATLALMGELSSKDESKQDALKLSEVLNAAAENFGPDTPILATLHWKSALVRLAHGEAAKALEEFDEALDISKKNLAEDDPQMALLMSQRASALRELGRVDEAISELEIAVERLRKAFGDDHYDVAEARIRMAVALDAKGRHEAAALERRKALDILRGVLRPDHPRLLRIESALPIEQAADDIALSVLEYFRGVGAFAADFREIEFRSGSVYSGRMTFTSDGKIFWRYDEPRRLEFIGNEEGMLFKDFTLGQRSRLAISETPFKNFFAALKGEDSAYYVTVAQRDSGQLHLRLISRDFPEHGAMHLVFSEMPLQLIGMNVRNALSGERNILFMNMKEGADADVSVFDDLALN